MFWNFGISILSLLALLCGNKIHKIQTFFKTVVSKKAKIWRWKESQSSDKLLSKIMSSSYHMKQKTSKQVASITYTLEKTFFAAASFEDL